MTIEQTIDRIIEQEIYTNASAMVTDLCNEGSHWAEHLMDCMGAPDYSEPPEGYKATGLLDPDYKTRRWMFEDIDGTESEDVYESEEAANRAAWEDSGDTPEEMQEALQFWLVSDWLADKLEQVGAPVARDVLGFEIWGRTECGQGLQYDSALHAVANLIE